MKHLIICREYPPAPGGGIGRYVFLISHLLAESGETVHVIGQMWRGAENSVEEKCEGRLIIHRLPFESYKSLMGPRPSSSINSRVARSLFHSNFYPQCFAWQAALLGERLIQHEGIDLVEAQEYEAPLYYLQIRRAFGLGPKRRPPCIVHFHSPMEFVVQHNDWDLSHPYFQTGKRLEDYSIGAADALICPSQYLACQLETHYGLKKDSIDVIPYPIDDGPVIERSNDTWRNGTVCYLGRLERRKGVIEWVDAAVFAAAEFPDARFEFIGPNVLGTDQMSGEEFMDLRIPKELRKRFLFRGEQKKACILHLLAGARIAVVPSRWENYPYACIEAMGSGLPVIASREGGMVEMIRDGQTGWLAKEPGSRGLMEALQRALELPAMKIAEMGRDAAAGIRQICNGKKIVEKHLDFRTRLVHQGTRNSMRVPVNLPWAKRALSDESARRIPQYNARQGVAIVLRGLSTGRDLSECLKCLEKQSRHPSAVVVVDNGTTEAHVWERLQIKGSQVIHGSGEELPSVMNTGIKSVLESDLDPLGFAFLHTKDRLDKDFIAACESVLRLCPEVGIVSCWTNYAEADASIWAKPCPSFPYQWLSNELAPFSVIRTEALLEVSKCNAANSHGYEEWEIFNAVMASGWAAVTYPGLLAHSRPDDCFILNTKGASGKRKIAREFLERYSHLIARDAKELVLLAKVDAESLKRKIPFNCGNHFAKARVILRHPRAVVRVLRTMANRII